MSFPRTDCPLRTDESFRNRTDSDHHKESSPIESLPIDIIQDFIIADSLHLLDLGVMKKCLTGWMYGSFNFRTKWCAQQIENLSKDLVNTNQTLPCEIHRAVQGLDCLKFWKGLEFRTFLLYIGIVHLKDYLIDEAYNHFLLLFCAVVICSSKEYCTFLNVAKNLFIDYIEQYVQIYGVDSIGSNVHNLCHIVDDVKKFGPLPSISAYPFENHLSFIKRLLRTGNRPLSQVAKRLIELSNSKIDDQYISDETYPIYKNKKKTNISCLNNCTSTWQTLIVRDGFTLKQNKKDSWFMTKEKEIVKFTAAVECNNELYVYGSSLKKKRDFFKKPFNSSHINIFSSSENLNEAGLFKISDVKCKMVCIKSKTQNVYIPLLHTL